MSCNVNRIFCKLNALQSQLLCLTGNVWHAGRVVTAGVRHVLVASFSADRFNVNDWYSAKVAEWMSQHAGAEVPEVPEGSE